MRRFSAIDLEPRIAASQGRLAVELSGPPAGFPRGLYALSFAVEGAVGGFAAALRYRRPSAPSGQCEIGLDFTVRRGRAVAVFVLPEAATGLRLVAPAAVVAGIGPSIRLRRLSSLLTQAWQVLRALAARMARPARWPRLVMRATAILRASGLRGLGHALQRAARGDAEARRGVVDYAHWAEVEDRDLMARREDIRARADALPSRPAISLVMPVREPQPEALRHAVESVCGQIWQDWQLCIAVDGSRDPAAARLVAEMAAREPRITVDDRGGNGGIATAANRAMERAAGDWLAFLGQGDVLSADALVEVAAAVNARPDAGLVYSDEDAIDDRSRRCRPNFKPDFNIDLFLSCNMIGDLACYRADLVRQAGGLRHGYDGAHGYDLALRVVERLEPARIVHLRRILYHRRLPAAGETPRGHADQPASAPAERALNDYLARNAIDARASREGETLRVTYACPAPPPRASIVIATRDRLALLQKCVASIVGRTDYPDYEIVVVDNGSKRRATLQWLSAMEAGGRIRCLRDDRPFNYAALNNAGVRIASGEIVVLLNNDVEVVTPGWLKEMVSVCVQPGVGAVGAKLLYPDRTVQHAGIVVDPDTGGRSWFRGAPGDFGGPGGRLKMRQRLSAVIGACLATRRDLYLEMGGLDEERFAVDFNDVDYCLELDRAGMRVVFTPHAELIHHESASRGRHLTPAKSAELYGGLLAMKEKWGARLETDPWAMPGLPRQLDRVGWME